MYDYLYLFAICSPSYTIFVWSGFRSILRGDRLILGGGGWEIISGHIVSSMSSDKKLIFR